MQIIIKLLKTSKKFDHIKTIELQDISIKRCYNIGIRLIYLRMITHGETYYSKYDFKPKKIEEDNPVVDNNNKMTDYKRFKYNKKIFKINRNLTNVEIISVINSSEIINNNTILFYEKVVKSYLKEDRIIDTSIFMKKIVSLAFDQNVSVEKRTPICDFIDSIYKNLYIKIGYKEYKSDLWTLKI
jgi:hypothetical protein